MASAVTVSAAPWPGCSALFLELFLFARAKAGRGAQRLAVVVQRQAAHVQRQRAHGRLLVHDDRDRTAFDTVAEPETAPAGKARVRPQ